MCVFASCMCGAVHQKGREKASVFVCILSNHIKLMVLTLLTYKNGFFTGLALLSICVSFLCVSL